MKEEERWHEISRLYHAARVLSEADRKAFLNACSDVDLRKEVSSLLENEDKAKSFFESPAIDEAARMKADEQSSLIGKQLGSYRIVSEIGKGGMGEVYQARDLKLGRDVAIKILPEDFAKDDDRVKRFQREAKLLASINHSNIATIHGLETTGDKDFLVMELVEGRTLYDLIKSGRMPVDSVLKIALQIAEALEAAHEKGVIHRDLKPANIKVTPNGKVKVLDFGLAKVLADGQQDINLSDAFTFSETATQQGVILGTAAYMSPEQAQGQMIDKRTDIWAFGCVLYEMLAGKAAFSGKNVTDVLASVIRSEPDWGKLPAKLHWRLQEVLERCLQKEPRDRYRDIADVRFDIGRIMADPGGATAQPAKSEPRTMLRRILPWVAVIIGTIFAGIGAWHLKPPELPELISFDHHLPEDQQINFDAVTQTGTILTISPDGDKIVYSTSGGLYLRSIDDAEAKLIEGTDDNPQTPFFSPDGQQIGYWSREDKKLKKIGINGGMPVDICDVSRVHGANWYPDDTIVYSDWPIGIRSISAVAGNPKTLIEQNNLAHPQLLEDGKFVMFTECFPTPYKIVVQSLESGERKEIVEGVFGRYIPPGHLIYSKYGTIFVAAFDMESLDIIGREVPIVEGVYNISGFALYSISGSGTLAYMPGIVLPRSNLVWVDGSGNKETIDAPKRAYGDLRMSPDGTKVVSAIDNKIGIWDLVLEREETLPTGNDPIHQPVWTPDGRKIIFNSSTDYQLYSINANGIGGVASLPKIPDHAIWPYSWSKDGSNLVLQEIKGEEYRIGMVSMEGEFKILLQRGVIPQVSPDGRFLAYQSDEEEAGRYEIYVRFFPDVSRDGRKISTSGGHSPLWSLDGCELYYRNGDAVMAATVEAGSKLDSGKPRELFRGNYFYLGEQSSTSALVYAPWDIGPDGRFLMVEPLDPQWDRRLGKISITLNWDVELKRIMSVE